MSSQGEGLGGGRGQTTAIRISKPFLRISKAGKPAAGPWRAIYQKVISERSPRLRQRGSSTKDGESVDLSLVEVPRPLPGLTLAQVPSPVLGSHSHSLPHLCKGVARIHTAQVLAKVPAPLPRSHSHAEVPAPFPGSHSQWQRSCHLCQAPVQPTCLLTPCCICLFFSPSFALLPPWAS